MKQIDFHGRWWRASLALTVSVMAACGGNSDPQTQDVLTLEGPNAQVSSMAADPGGGVTFTWSSFGSGFSNPRWGMQRGVGGQWAAVQFPESFRNFSLVTYAQDASGPQSVLLQDTSGPQSLHESHRVVDGWSPPMPIPWPQITHLELRGHAALSNLIAARFTGFFEGGYGQRDGVLRLDNQGWHVETLFEVPEPLPSNSYQGPTAISPDGRAVAVWIEYQEGKYLVSFRSYAPGRGWAPAMRLLDGLQGPPMAAAVRPGGYVITHLQCTAGSCVPAVTQFDDSGAKTTSTISSPVAVRPDQIHLSASSGDALSLWEEVRPTNGMDNEDLAQVLFTWSSLRRPSGEWTPLAPAPQFVTQAEVRPSGRVLVQHLRGWSVLDPSSGWRTIDLPIPIELPVWGGPGPSQSRVFATDTAGFMNFVWTQGNRSPSIVVKALRQPEP